MKKIIYAMGMVAFLYSCGDNASGNAAGNAADIEKGFALISNNDCVTCHRPDEVLTGPSYTAIASKYAGLSDTIVSHLADKIVSGGSGVWGQIPMVPHTGITKEDAGLMAKYILSQKK